jgi:hypothetical protein
VESNGYFGFEESGLLFSGRHTRIVYQNAFRLSSYETEVLICGFEMVGPAGRAVSGVSQKQPKHQRQPAFGGDRPLGLFQSQIVSG